MDEEGSRLLECRQDLHALVQSARDSVRKVTRRLTVRDLPFDIQETIIRHALTTSGPVLEFGALYAPGRAFGRDARAERRHHLAVTQTCRDWRRYKDFYLQNNTFTFLDAAGFVKFLQRVGFANLDKVKSIMMLSPVLNNQQWTVPALSPTRMALPLFTNLTSFTLVDPTCMEAHPGVAATLEYLYTLAAFRPSLKHIDVVDPLDFAPARFLLRDLPLRAPKWLHDGRVALRVGLARLSQDLSDPARRRPNPYCVGWFAHSHLRFFLESLGGARAFPAVWAAAAGLTALEPEPRPAWGAWARAAAADEAALRRALGPRPAPYPAQTAWPADAQGRYVEADAQGRAEAALESFAVVGQPLPARFADRPVHLEDLRRGMESAAERRERWPQGAALGHIRPATGWLSAAFIAPTDRLRDYPTITWRHGEYGHTVAIMLGINRCRHALRETPEEYRMDRLFFY